MYSLSRLSVDHSSGRYGAGESNKQADKCKLVREDFRKMGHPFKVRSAAGRRNNSQSDTEREQRMRCDVDGWLWTGGLSLRMIQEIGR